MTVEPCVMCAGASAWAQLRAVVYGAATDENRVSAGTGPCCTRAPSCAAGVRAERVRGAHASRFFGRQA
ncbi:MAG: hypothetical protein WKG07_02915 [Hymenobacter sp.]